MEKPLLESEQERDDKEYASPDAEAPGVLSFMRSRATYVLVTRLHAEETFFALQHIIAKRASVGWTGVPAVVEWCWLMTLMNAASTIQSRRRFRTPKGPLPRANSSPGAPSG